MTLTAILRGAARTARNANVIFPVLAVTLALLTAGALLAATGTDAVAALGNAFDAALGGTYAVSTTITKALPRLFAALGIAIALRAGLWNIGAEGQLYVGALGAVGVALALEGFP
ncbi:MAG: hypothetical protein WD377_02895, partial [Nitriliruptoraceae bacterium]